MFQGKRRTIFMFILLILSLLVVGCVSLFVWLWVTTPPSKDYVLMEKRLAEELGIDPTNIQSFGPGPFPYNYYRWLVEQGSKNNLTPQSKLTRSDIHRIMRGYVRVVKCGGLDRNWEVYFFYDLTYSESSSVWANYEPSNDINHDRDVFLGFYVMEKELVRSIGCTKIYDPPSKP